VRGHTLVPGRFVEVAVVAHSGEDYHTGFERGCAVFAPVEVGPAA
jgi:hypothetical protein